MHAKGYWNYVRLEIGGKMTHFLVGVSCMEKRIICFNYVMNAFYNKTRW